jgi:tetratricopeptide (TPR) repeat protein
MSRLEPRKLALGLFVIFSLGSAPLAARGQEPKKADSSLTFQAHMETIYVNFDQKTVVPWLKPIFDVLDHRFIRETKPRTIVVEVTLHTDRPAEVVVASRPALSAADTKAVLDTADIAKSPHSLVVDGTFRIMTRLNGGTPDDSGPFSPPLRSREDRELALFNRENSAAGKRTVLRGWARREAIPLLAAFAIHRDQLAHEATRKFGKALQGVKGEGPIDVAALTDKNSDFWRAMIESPRGDLLVPASAIALRAADGQLHYARRLADALEVFASEDFGAVGLLREFRTKARLYEDGLSASIRNGVALHDAGRFDEAMKIYDDVLKDDPKSPRALYERFQTELAKSLKTQPSPTPDWSAARKAIILADPLYESMAEASSTDELYELLLRKEIGTLFKKRESFTRDIIRLADIALDLGQPGFAAMVYWNAWREIDPAEYANRDLSEDMLYCLEQLGVKDVKAKFPGDHAAQFKRIDAERARRKRQAPRAIGPDHKSAKGKP